MNTQHHTWIVQDYSGAFEQAEKLRAIADDEFERARRIHRAAMHDITETLNATLKKLYEEGDV